MMMYAMLVYLRGETLIRIPLLCLLCHNAQGITGGTIDTEKHRSPLSLESVGAAGRLWIVPERLNGRDNNAVVFIFCSCSRRRRSRAFEERTCRTDVFHHVVPQPVGACAPCLPAACCSWRPHAALQWPIQLQPRHRREPLKPSRACVKTPPSPISPSSKGYLTSASRRSCRTALASCGSAPTTGSTASTATTSSRIATTRRTRTASAAISSRPCTRIAPG